MRPFIVTSIIASLAAFTSATSLEERQITSVTLFFYTTDGGKFQQTFPTDMSSHKIDNPATVSHVYNPGGAYCSVHGTKGETLAVPINDHKFKEPQPVDSAFCARL
ncbi:hypothetical protein ETB97_001739 [Aspergillus alliaceus]|uniref:Uncharacterized protein n=1 Tax=Petromyces alliaceus TaxID=209559 RepID=A0A5N6FLH4_PETAA|nr:uncharacterized protein BDW43DRAFT_284023 [Aspergillus alliaceus]KAB8230781.1 hypothetical protein BDW43DRAFT_284023 [Aspergillus alliaceus]KAF5860319.1 hypothetical protein ETB97_001739 [Aspergillus burnettii]